MKEPKDGEKMHKLEPEGQYDNDLVSEPSIDPDLRCGAIHDGFKTPRKNNSFESMEDQESKMAGLDQGWIARNRSSSPMMDNIANKIECMTNSVPKMFAYTKVSHFRQISNLTPEGFECDKDDFAIKDTSVEKDKSDNIDSEDVYDNAQDYVHIDAGEGHVAMDEIGSSHRGIEKGQSQPTNNRSRAQSYSTQPTNNWSRTQSYNSHDNFDNRELHVKGHRLVPVPVERSAIRRDDNDSLSPPRSRNWRSNHSCFPDFENVKRQTRRGFQHMKKKHQNRSSKKSHYQGRKPKTKKNRRSGSCNNLTACKSNTDDFSLRNNSYKRRQSKSNLTGNSSARKLDDMEFMSDMSDNDPQDERLMNEHFAAPRIASSFAQHIPRNVVLNLSRHIANGYDTVAQIMESHTSSNSINDALALSRSMDRSMDKEFMEEVEDEVHSEGSNQSIINQSMIERGISDITLERHIPNFSPEANGDGVSSVTLPVDQTFVDFMKNGEKILKGSYSPNVNTNDSTDDLARAADSVESDITPIRPMFTRPGILQPSFVQHEAPKTMSVKDRVQAYEVQNKLEANVASGSQVPSTPRSRPSQVHAKKPPPQCLFKKFQPTKHNDTLKVLFLSSPHCEEDKTTLIHRLSKQKRKKLSENNMVDVNVYNWEPQGSSTTAIDSHMLGFGARKPTKFCLFDLRGGNIECGSHASQFLFFSPNSLYVIVWDMAVSNNKVVGPIYEDDRESDFEKRKRGKLKNKAINRDIDNNVLYWLDVIDELNFPGSVIMPVVLKSSELSDGETKKRCDMLKERLLKHNRDAMIVFDSDDEVPRVDLHEDELDGFRCAMISCGSETSVLDDHFKELSPILARTGDVVSMLKSKDYNVIQFREIYSEISKRLGDNILEEDIREALVFLSSIGEIVYFGDDITECANPDLLKQFIVLQPEWISNAIAPVLCQEDISDIRKNFDGTAMSPIGECFKSLFVTEYETLQIWGDTDYVREHNNSDTEADIEESELFYFLQQVCEHCGIFLPFTLPGDIGESISYLLPRVTVEPSNSPWTFTSTNPYKTIICYSWLIREVLPITFMDNISAAVANDLIEMFGQDDEPDRLGNVTSVEQILFYKTAIYVRIVSHVRQRGKKTTELYICLAHSDSRNCVSSSDMRDTDRKLMVCGKGFLGKCGENIWKLGYESILKTVGDVVKNRTKGHFSKEIACPECLLAAAPQKCSFWKAHTIESQPAEENLRCNNRCNVHSIRPQLLRGELMNCEDDDCSIISTYTAWSSISHSTAMTYLTADTCDRQPNRSVTDMLPSIVLVGVWDTRKGSIVYTGSGFIADKTRGLVVTAGHVFYDFHMNTRVGDKYFGIDDAIAIVGVYNCDTETANFQYTADVLCHDLQKADCCILHLKEKFEIPIDANGCHISYPQAMAFRLDVPSENLVSLNLTQIFELETGIRVIGYNQEGEGLHHEEREIDRRPCFSHGHVLKKMDSSQSITRNPDAFVHNPQSEIVISTNARTKFGHSGGPCVNSNGEVIGILSRSDPVEEGRSYLAPSKLIRSLLAKAKHNLEDKAKGKFQSNKGKVRFAGNSTANQHR